MGLGWQHTLLRYVSKPFSQCSSPVTVQCAINSLSLRGVSAGVQYTLLDTCQSQLLSSPAACGGCFTLQRCRQCVLVWREYVTKKAVEEVRPRGMSHRGGRESVQATAVYSPRGRGGTVPAVKERPVEVRQLHLGARVSRGGRQHHPGGVAAHVAAQPTHHTHHHVKARTTRILS